MNSSSRGGKVATVRFPDVGMTCRKCSHLMTCKVEDATSGSENDERPKASGGLHMQNAHQSVIAHKVDNEQDINFGKY